MPASGLLAKQPAAGQPEFLRGRALSMAISERSRRLLWGRAAGICSFQDCRRQLTLENEQNDVGNVGHEAHIVGREPGSARCESVLAQVDRDDYNNLILVCRHHHGIIDERALSQDYPVERLHATKADHETWVAEHLVARDRVATAAEVVYADLIDKAVLRCRLDRWREWTQDALG